MVIGIKSKFLEIEASDPADIPPNSLFIDSTNNNQATFKNSGGTSSVVGAVSTSNLFIKQMQADQVIAINDPLAKKSNGRVIKSDTDLSADSQKYIGIALQAAANVGDFINVLLIGTNLANALLGMGFVPGEYIFLGENGGFTNDAGVSGFSGSNDSVIRVGIADCAPGTASGVATDLIAITQIISVA